MQAFVIWLARVSALGGVALIAVAFIARLSGVYSLGGFNSGTVLQAGMAVMLLACLAYLIALAEGRRS